MAVGGGYWAVQINETARNVQRLIHNQAITSGELWVWISQPTGDQHFRQSDARTAMVQKFDRSQHIDFWRILLQAL